MSMGEEDFIYSGEVEDSNFSGIGTYQSKNAIVIANFTPNHVQSHKFRVPKLEETLDKQSKKDNKDEHGRGGLHLLWRSRR